MKNEKMFEFMVPYSQIQVHFVAGSGGGGYLQPVNVTVQSGMNIYDEEYSDVRFALTLLNNLGQISYTGAQQIVSKKTGRVLLTLSEEGTIVVSSDVTSDDDISYFFTKADREYFVEEDIDEETAPYSGIKVHFMAGSGGGGNVDLTALSGTIRNGMKFDDDENTYFAFFFLQNYFNQIKMEYELDEEGEFTGNILFSSKADKLLFIMNDDNIITIADGVTSDDDIIYTITEEDRNKLLEEDPEAYAFIAPYKTVQLHFDTSGGGGGNVDPTGLLATLKTGINTSNEKNEETLIALTLMIYYFNQLQMNYDEETGGATFLSLAGKELFTMNNNSFVTLAPGITSDDNIVYTITSEDRESLRNENKDFYDFPSDYNTIEIRFAPQTETLEATLRDETNLADENNQQILKVVQLLVMTFNTLTTGYEDGMDAIYSPTDKLLFTVTEEGIANVNQDLEVGDNVVYTITEEDRENLYYSDKDTYELLLDYKAIALYFNYNDPDGIERVTENSENFNGWYTLDGRQVVNGKLPRGIYIKGGRKVVVE